MFAFPNVNSDKAALSSSAEEIFLLLSRSLSGLKLNVFYHLSLLILVSLPGTHPRRWKRHCYKRLYLHAVTVPIDHFCLPTFATPGIFFRIIVSRLISKNLGLFEGMARLRQVDGASLEPTSWVRKQTFHDSIAPRQESQLNSST